MLEYILCSASLKICRKQTSLANVTDAEIPYRSCPVAFTFFGCIILSACLVYLSVSLFQQMEEQFKALIVLSHYLETARFRQFWDDAANNRHILEAVPGFEQAIQSYAIHVLSLTYQKVPRHILAEAINIEGLALDKFLEYHAANSGWVIEKGGQSQVIVLPRNEFNHPQLKKNTADTVPFEHLTRIFPVLS
ncbi:uncharacterized LOC100194334 [Zea mays]|uniref:Eukaryotic translation initiation factor 3 subunit K n=1 Tax=Zea mays TaxID=4577 RepID=B4FIB5_MAIZE|nr:uncharacterized LOC100194334 [Zea mays]ACF81858.1 unknown [Zea mays]ONL94295.1 Eukaryotic translation initiation factor 3 subunit K [Zea mays]|eukprot:NP_001132842.1 uncharacterized protein LOC100194334 [Zea mays]